MQSLSESPHKNADCSTISSHVNNEWWIMSFKLLVCLGLDRRIEFTYASSTVETIEKTVDHWKAQKTVESTTSSSFSIASCVSGLREFSTISPIRFAHENGAPEDIRWRECCRWEHQSYKQGENIRESSSRVRSTDRQGMIWCLEWWQVNINTHSQHTARHSCLCVSVEIWTHTNVESQLNVDWAWHEFSLCHWPTDVARQRRWGVCACLCSARTTGTKRVTRARGAKMNSIILILDGRARYVELRIISPTRQWTRQLPENRVILDFVQLFIGRLCCLSLSFSLRPHTIIHNLSLNVDVAFETILSFWWRLRG